MATILTLCVGMSTGFYSVLSSVVATLRTDIYPAVARDQMLVGNPDERGGAVPAEALSIVSSLTRIAPIGVRLVDRGPIQYTVGDGPLGAGGMGVMTVSSADALSVVLEVPLSQTQRSALLTGGVVTSGEGSVVQLRTWKNWSQTGATALQAAHIDLPRLGWLDGVGAFMLDATASSLGLPRAEPTRIYPAVPSDTAQSIRDAITVAGYDPETVQMYQKPPPAIPDEALTLSALLLVAMVLVATWTMCQEIRRSLAGPARTLWRLGVRSGYIATVMAVESGMCLAVGLVAGLLSGMVGPLVAGQVSTGLQSAVDWPGLVALTGSIILAALVCLLVSGHQFRVDVHDE